MLMQQKRDIEHSFNENKIPCINNLNLYFDILEFN